MELLSFIIWNGSPEIFSFPNPFMDGQFGLRWYGLLFASGFLISQQLLYFIYKKEGKPEKDVDTLTIYMVVATVIGARLGHVLFYEPERYLSNPLDILKVWEGGLASHGAAVGILFALWLYGRKKKPGQSYLQVVDRIVILVAMTGALIRIGNYFNSEIIGKPTNSGYGVVFTRYVTEIIENDGFVKSVSFAKGDPANVHEGYPAIKILIEFKGGGTVDEASAHNYLQGRVTSLFSFNPYIREHIHNEGNLDYGIAPLENGQLGAVINTHGIPRHPSQLYEAFSCILLFAFLWWIWSRQKENLPPGKLLGIFLIVCFGLRFIYEFLKENQVDFENELPLNMGQWLSIPLVLLGVYILWRSYKNQPAISKVGE
ncbi:MAG: prolipoprotein diacylglyceryl transferase [Flammeovirgaceae bacterium]|nr:prolipoprotein diacylglyceryl transferase [Flammeovirgaceae bacterium]